MDATETTVAAVREAGENALAIDLETPGGFEAEPGQFVRLTAPVGETTESRFYTVSSPNTVGTFEFTVGFDPEEAGPFSDYLRGIEAGDTVTVAGPFGSHHYEAEPRVVVVAGGPGVGPAVAIAERALADDGRAPGATRSPSSTRSRRAASSWSSSSTDGDAAGAGRRASAGRGHPEAARQPKLSIFAASGSPPAASMAVSASATRSSKP